MAYKISLELHFEEEATIQQAKDQLLPLYQNAIVINEGQENEERGFIELQHCLHDIGEPCVKLARWEVGRGRVYPTGG